MVDPAIDSVTMAHYAQPSEPIQPLQTLLSPAFHPAVFNQMKLALTYVEDAIAWINHLGQVEWCNAAFDRLSQLLTSTILEFVQAKDALESSEDFSEVRYEISLEDQLFGLKVIRSESGGECGAGTILMVQQQASFNDRPPANVLLPIQTSQPEALLPEAQLQMTLNYVNVGSWSWDIASGNIAWDKNTERLLGLSPGTYPLIYETWRNCVHPDDLESIEQSMTDALATSSDINVEYRVVYPDSSLHWLSSRGRGVCNQVGELVQATGLIIDITDRKQTELALAASEAKLQQQQEFLRRVIDADPNLIFVKDSGGNFVLANQAIADFYNLTIEEILTKKLEDFYPNPETAKRLLKQNQWVIRNQQNMFIAEEAVESAPHHDIAWLQWQKQPIWLPDRPEYGVLGIGVNISEAKRDEVVRKQTEAALTKILQRTATVYGENFFSMLVQSLVSALGVDYVGISELSDAETFSTLACWSANQMQLSIDYSLSTVPPCVQALEQGVYICSSQLQTVFPNVEILERLEAESYLGVAMHDASGTPIGVLCIMDTQPIADVVRTESLLHIFAARAATELECKRATEMLDQTNQALKASVNQRTQELLQSQEELQKQTYLLEAILDNIGDGLLVTDLNNQFLVFNLAAQRILGLGAVNVTHSQSLERYGVYLSDRITPCPIEELPLRRAMRGEVANNVEVFIRNSQRPAGIFLDLTICPFRDKAGMIIGGIAAFRDITRKKEVDQALRQREQEFRTLVENSPDIITRFDRQFRYLYVNPKLEQEIEIPAAEFIGKTSADMGFPEPLVAQWTEQIQQAVITGEEQTLEYALDLPLGKQIHEARYVPEFDPDGVVQSVLVVTRLITALKQAEAALRDSEAQLWAIFENAPIAIGLADIKTHRCIHRNASHRALFGYDDDDIEAVTVEMITHPDDIAANLYQVQRLLAGEIADFQMQKRFIHQNGNLLWGSLTCALIRNAEGSPLYIMGMIENISEAKRDEAVRKQTERKLLIVQEQLFLAQERLHHLLSSSPGIIYAATPSGTSPLALTFISTNVRQILGYESQECLEADFWLNGIHPDDRSLFKTAEQEMLQQGYAACEYRFCHRNGDYRWLYDQTKLVLDEGGKPLERIGSWMDISDRKAAEEELCQTNEQLALTNAELAQATRLKDEFLANMSHELRTPLNSILGLSEVMQEGAFGTLNNKQRQFLSIIQSSGNHLLEMINDVLDLAKIEAGRLDLHIAETSIYNLCEASLTMIRQQAHQKNISLACDLTDDLGTLQVDERRMRQVLLNLLSNAVKFTPNGGSVNLEVQENLFQNSISFSIIDTGIGIASEDMSKLFQTFVQLDSSLSRHYEGTGLGLVLVKQIVELHGGQITVSSEKGQGSCFQVTVPRATSENQGTLLRGVTYRNLLKPHFDLLSQPCILLAEDDPDNVATLTDYLQARGFKITLALDGADAVQKAIAQPPHLVLINVQIANIHEMRLDGVEAIRQIRSHLSSIPIIALTHESLPGEQERCHMAGANTYLIKPVRLKQLFELIQQRLNL